MAERLKAPVSKAGNGVTRSGVQIPLPPPIIYFTSLINFIIFIYLKITKIKQELINIFIKYE